jgi:hypothetical protein
MKAGVRRRSITCHEGTEGKARYSYTLSLTSALGGGGWSTPRPGRFTPGKETRYPLAGWAPGPVWMGTENLASNGIRSPDCPVCSESLYRLSYRGRIRKYVQLTTDSLVPWPQQTAQTVTYRQPDKGSTPRLTD